MKNTSRFGRAPAGKRIAVGALLLAIPLSLATCGKDATGPEPVIPATITISVNSVADSARVGSGVIRKATLTVSGTNQEPVRWTATISNQSNWLSLSASSGGVPRTLEVMLDPGDLPVGLHRDTIIFTPTGNTAARKRVPVQLVISECEVYSVAFGAEVSDSLGVEDCEAPNRSDRFAKLHGFDGNQNDSVTVILRSADFQGYLVLVNSTSTSGSPLAEDSRCRGFAGDPCLYNVRLPATATYVVQATTRDARATGSYTLTIHKPRYPDPPNALGQFFQDGVTSIAPGGSVGDTSLAFRANVTDQDSLDDLRLEIELRTVGTAFSGVPTHSSQLLSSGDTGLVIVTTTDDSEYHWQARTIDGTGRASAWVSYGNNSEDDPDFRVGVSEIPPAPTGLAQLRLDSTTTVSIGESLDEAAVVLRGTVSDPDPADRLRLEVEVRPVGTALTGTATGTSEEVSSGTTVLVSVVGLKEDTPYHWSARTVDDGGSASAWVSFGGNGEDEADFAVAIPATRLAFDVQPSNATAGAAIAPAVQVSARETSGAVDNTFTGPITLAITAGTGTGGAQLLGTTTVNSVGGIATFSDLNVELAGSGYTLDASSGTLGGATSDGFDIAAGAVSQLDFTVQPTSVNAGTTISPAVEVTGRDDFGNVVTSFTSNVTVTIGTNPGGGTLTGTLTRAATAGVATFSDLSIDVAANGYTLNAASGGVSVTSNAFDVVAGAATQLAFVVQPADATAGESIAPAVQVAALDNVGNTVTTFAGDVTVSIVNNPSGGTLFGGVTVTAVNGVATFSDLSIDMAGFGYTLGASATGPAGATSEAFDISPAAAAQLVITVQPSDATAGQSITPAVQVTAYDEFGNLATGFASNVTASLGSNPGGGSLLGTTTVGASNGVATFSNLSIDRAGNGYTLNMVSGSMSDTSDPFEIVGGNATQLAFIVQPSEATQNAVISPAVTVAAQDGFGNIAADYTTAVTMTIGTNPGGGVLTGTLTVTPVNGVATFGDLSIDAAGNGYTLVATSGPFNATSDPFEVVGGSATQLVFTVQPGNATAGQPIAPAIQVTARDDAGNTATDFTRDVTLSIGTNPAGGTLSGTLTVTAVAGVATFSNVSIDRAGTGYTLVASATGPASGTSAPFNVVGATVAQLGFSTQPTDATAGEAIAPAVEVTAYDSFGNVDPGFTGNVTVAIGSNPGGGTLSGTLTAAAVGGVAVFADLSIELVGDGYTLTATSGALDAAESGGFDIGPGEAVRLAFTVHPVNTVAGELMPAVEVTAYDEFGNVATNNGGGIIEIEIDNNPSGGTLSGVKGLALREGVVRFSNLSIDLPGVGYTLIATCDFDPGVSNPFDILEP